MNSATSKPGQSGQQQTRQYYKCHNCKTEILLTEAATAVALTRKLKIDGKTHLKGTVFRFCDYKCYMEWVDGRETGRNWIKSINWKTANLIEWANKMGEQAESMTGNPGHDPGDKHKHTKNE